MAAVRNLKVSSTAVQLLTSDPRGGDCSQEPEVQLQSRFCPLFVESEVGLQQRGLFLSKVNNRDNKSGYLGE